MQQRYGAVLQSEHFPFLGVNNVQTPMINMHCRTTFYTALGRLLMVELGEDEEQFERFMMPLRGTHPAWQPLGHFNF